VASRLAAGAEVLGGGSRRQGLVLLVALAAGAVLLPVLLMSVVGSRDTTGGAAVLALVLGLVVDLLVVVLVLVLVTHTLTQRRLQTANRALSQLGGRTAALERSLGEHGAAPGRRPGPPAATRADVEAVVKDAGRRLQVATVTEVGNRLQATQNLFALVTPRGPVPQMVGYVAAPDVLLVLVQKLLKLRPTLAIECGSGTSTLFLALAAQQYGINCRLVSLEHQLAYAEGTRALLADHGVGHLVDVRHAPLTSTPLPDHPGPWYDPAAWEDLHDIGLAFVDGPPGDVGPQARYPMVPLLRDRLAERCVILLDDMNRADERGVGERWMAQLEGFDYRFLPLARGVGVFTRNP
jgi:methyltransferase family protein